MIRNYDKKHINEIEIEKIPSENNIKQVESKKKEIKANELLGKKQHRTSKEDWLKQKAIKLEERKKQTKYLNKKTPKGQPVMRYQIQNLLNKIKNKKYNGEY